MLYIVFRMKSAYKMLKIILFGSNALLLTLSQQCTFRVAHILPLTTTTHHSFLSRQGFLLNKQFLAGSLFPLSFLFLISVRNFFQAFPRMKGLSFASFFVSRMCNKHRLMKVVFFAVELRQVSKMRKILF